MRIGLALVNLAMGGAQRWMIELAQGLAARGHSIAYYCAARPTPPGQIDLHLQAALDRCAQAQPSPRSLLNSQVIHLDGYHSLRRKLAYLPAWPRCLETYHSGYSVRRSGPLYPPLKVAVSQAVQRLLPGASQVIYQGIGLPPDAPADANRIFDVAILGRLHPVKQHLLFLQVCELLYRQRGRLSALIIGGHPSPGSYQQQVDAEIERLRAGGLQIQVTGEVGAAGDIFAWLRQVRLLLVTSQDEGFGRMTVEALACRTPVIANPVGGLCEIIQPGVNGLLARRDDPASFAALANSLLDDPARCRDLGAAGRQDVARRFSLEAMLDQYEMLYQSLGVL
jgi:glycosyltransferase involved in cell wall biosynthesis